MNLCIQFSGHTKYFYLVIINCYVTHNTRAINTSKIVFWPTAEGEGIAPAMLSLVLAFAYYTTIMISIGTRIDKYRQWSDTDNIDNILSQNRIIIRNYDVHGIIVLYAHRYIYWCVVIMRRSYSKIREHGIVGIDQMYSAVSLRLSPYTFIVRIKFITLNRHKRRPWANVHGRIAFVSGDRFRSRSPSPRRPPDGITP